MSSYKKILSVHHYQKIIYCIRLGTIDPGGHSQSGQTRHNIPGTIIK